MNINQIKYCVSVYENQSFSVAARIRGVSVQAVSKAINDLEVEVGAKLFNRYNRGASPTPAGRAFYAKARPALKALEELETFDPSVADLEANPNLLRIGMCTPAFNRSETLFQGLANFVKKGAGFELSIVLADPRTAQRDLEHHVFDALATVGTYHRPGVDCTILGSLPTGINVAPNHPLAGKPFVTLSELSEYPAGVSPIYDSFNESILSIYRVRGLVDKAREINSVAEEDVRFMTEEHGYFFTALIPTGIANDGSFITVPIDPKESINIPICLITLSGKKPALYDEAERFFVQTIGVIAGKKR